MTEDKYIDIRDDKSYRELKKKYNKAVSDHKEQFKFQGEPMLTKFAGYLIKHIERIRKMRGWKIEK